MLGGAAGQDVGAAPAARPNVVVIETDGQSLTTLHVMPNVQRLLAAQGATFENSFASWPLCCPSRATLLTGQYAHNHGVLGNTPPSGGYAKLDHSNTLAVWLQRAGYHTVHVGKYLNGYGRRDNETQIPAGWSEWHAGTRLAFFGHSMNENGRIVTFGDNAADYQTDVYSRIAQDVVRRRAPQAKPFFMWLAFFAPHGGGPPDPDDPRGLGTTKPAPRHHDRFASEPLPQPPSINEQDVSDKPAAIRNRPLLGPDRLAAVREAYQQQLESLLAVDEAVGQLVAELRARGELSSTLIVFTSDNGFFHGEHRVPSGKNLVYEPSVRVPLIVRGPGVRPGTRVGRLVANIDIAATIVDAARARPGRTLDGLSLLRLLRSPRLGGARPILLERTPTGTGRRAAQQAFAAIRTARYVYVEHGSGERELYDLARDPYQLESKHADPASARIRDDLARRLARLRSCRGAACRAP